jgi:hypothetical protein
MNCQRCNSQRVIHCYAKANDLAMAQFGKKEHDGYYPEDLGIEGGSEITFDYCLNCGQIQGTWPVPLSLLEQGKPYNDDDDDKDEEDEDDDDEEEDDRRRDASKSLDPRDHALEAAGVYASKYLVEGEGKLYAVFMFWNTNTAEQGLAVLKKFDPDIQVEQDDGKFVIVMKPEGKS